MSNIGIIPARGGSKGIPRKNVRSLCGKPLVAWVIEAALASGHLDRVVVSTDDTEIAQLSQRYGAEVVMRPAELADDKASSESALLHALDWLEQAEGYVPDLLVFLQCTSPLTLAEDIDGTVQALLNEQADSALAVAPFHYFLWQQDSSGDAAGINHDKRVRLRRQDREPQYQETGAVYVMRTQGFRQARHRFFGKTALYVTPPERCLEIDELVDFQIAEVLIRERERGRQLDLLPNPVSALFLDFDGVFTDNRVVVLEDGTEGIWANRSDGWGLGHLRDTGLPILVLSTEKNPVAAARCEKLKLPYQIGLDDKLEALLHYARQQRIDLATAVYLGNDVNDLDCMRRVGYPF